MAMMRASKEEGESHWVSVSDLMSVLMMIFLFISVSYMIEVTKKKEDIQKERDTIQEIVKTYKTLQIDLYESLVMEFEDDLSKWNANIDQQTISIRFQSPEVLFEAGSSELKNKFKEILEDFFPRYLKILNDVKYRENIEEIRIEGHTSSEWFHGVSSEQAYLNNMKLSQDRTREVLRYVLSNKIIEDKKDWLRERLTANGLSSSKSIWMNGIEDKERSRRVEFRVRAKAEKIISRIDELRQQ
jgi:outer membrane protein OmpA-like peptidoglycan-associated protein